MKTRVYKLDSKWYCEYYMPYSGILRAECDTWYRAMREACNVENAKGISVKIWVSE